MYGVWYGGGTAAVSNKTCIYIYTISAWAASVTIRTIFCQCLRLVAFTRMFRRSSSVLRFGSRNCGLCCLVIIMSLFSAVTIVLLFFCDHGIYFCLLELGRSTSSLSLLEFSHASSTCDQTFSNVTLWSLSRLFLLSSVYTVSRYWSYPDRIHQGPMQRVRVKHR